MIAKQIIGKNFRSLLAYHETKVETGEAKIIGTNMTMGSIGVKLRQLNMVRELRPSLGRSVYHVTLSLPASDSLNDENFAELASDYLNDMRFLDNQYIVYRHFDQNHDHIHIVANRVCYDGKVVSDSNNYRRSELAVRKIERKYNLQRLENSNKSKRKALTQNEIEKAVRTGTIPMKLFLQRKIDRIIEESDTIENFNETLIENEIFPEFNKSKTTGHISGISFKCNGVIYKGSTLGKKYSWKKILKHFIKIKNNGKSIKSTGDCGPANSNSKAIAKNHSKSSGNLQTAKPNRTNDGSKHKNDTSKPSNDYERNKQANLNKSDDFIRPRRRR